MKPNPGRSVGDIPVEIWLEIISKLNNDRQSNLHLPSLSLVCKHFLSIVNIHKHTLRILEPTVHFLPSLLRRFPNLNHISFFKFSGDPLPSLHRIADFNFRLESLDLSIPIDALVKSLPVSTLISVKSLRLCSSIADDDLKLIGDFFPNLEELDLRPSKYENQNYHFYSRNVNQEYTPWFNQEHEITTIPGLSIICSRAEQYIGKVKLIPYHGLSVLASRLKYLRRVKLNDFDWVTDEGLISLSDNCLNLEEIVVKHCRCVTKVGSRYALWKCKNLKAFGSDWMEEIWMPLSTKLNLSVVHLAGGFVSDDTLLAMVNADLPLKSCTLYCQEVSIDVLLLFLRKYNSLDYLSVEGSRELSDESMITLAKSLKEVKSLKLNECHCISGETLFTLIEQCPKLKSVVMMRCIFRNQYNNEFKVDSALKCRIKTLNLLENLGLCDAFLRKIAYACPELEELRLRQCENITEVGVWEILRNCPRLRNLAIDWCEQVDSLKLPDKDTLALEVLGASNTGLTDTVLVDISKKCPNLKSLNVVGCEGLTSKGVVQIVDKCTKLREIYLDKCLNMTDDILTWMIFRRLSLRKIGPPQEDVLSDDREKAFFIRHGCYLGSDYYKCV